MKRIVIQVLCLALTIYLCVVLAQFIDEQPSNVPTVATSEPTTEPIVTPEPTADPTSYVTPEVTVEPTPITTPEPIIEPTILELHQINVGCADAYLLRSDDFTIMIDGGQKDSTSGGKNVRQHVLNYLENVGVTTLDAYIGTHWHGDHVENMIPILDKFADANTVVFGNSPKLPNVYNLSSWKGNYTQMVDGDVFQFGDTIIKCVGPYKLHSGENYNSLNFLVTHGETKILMTGDYIHKEVLKNHGEELRDIDVYKMAHHGLKVSNYSGSPDVLTHLNPDIVLVPANSSGPTQNLLANFGISANVYDNKSGNIIVTTDGQQIKVTTEK